jgi:hypothetical protein
MKTTKLISFVDTTNGRRLTKANGRLFFCRGAGKCSDPAPEKRKKRCSDCVEGDMKETVRNLVDRIERGDA